ncbi:MAG: RidA family protein [Pseudomonadota bacterium]
MIERRHTSQRMSKVVVHNGVAYLCGPVGARDTVTDQTQDCLSRIDALLTEAGSEREDTLQAVVWLADMADFDKMTAVWDAWVPTAALPAHIATLVAPSPRYSVAIFWRVVRRRPCAVSRECRALRAMSITRSSASWACMRRKHTSF